jgi:hypothetical protein
MFRLRKTGVASKKRFQKIKASHYSEDIFLLFMIPIQPFL